MYLISEACFHESIPPLIHTVCTIRSTERFRNYLGWRSLLSPAIDKPGLAPRQPSRLTLYSKYFNVLCFTNRSSTGRGG